MSTLRERLADLAEDTPPPAPAPADLWSRGRSYARRRTAATVGAVVAAVLVATVGTAGLVGRAQDSVEPARPQGRAVLPDRFFEPSGRLPTVRGASGTLVAVVPAQHATWRGDGGPGLVGVSAVDQTYAFLDLPGWVGAPTEDTWSLSPDGRYVAYWYGEEATDESPVADGVAVLDTSSGEVRRHALESRRGLLPTTFGWVGDTVWFQQMDYTGASSANSAGTWALDATGAAPRAVSDPRLLLGDIRGTASGGFLTGGPGNGWFVIRSEADLAGPPVTRFRTNTIAPSALSPDDRTLALTRYRTDGLPVVRLAEAGSEESRVVEGVGRFPSVVGWLDQQVLAVVGARGDQRRLEAVDVTSGDVRTLARLPGADNGMQLATDLLGSPVVRAEAPPEPADPRLVAGAVGLGVLLLAAAGLWWRRRRGTR